MHGSLYIPYGMKLSKIDKNTEKGFSITNINAELQKLFLLLVVSTVNMHHRAEQCKHVCMKI